jgi:UDP-glucose:(galactosyl)LPS alpha-1,2-glucosyltransferase
MKKLPIFFSFDDRYVVPAAVTFESLLTNARPDVWYDLFVLHDDVTTENQRLLDALVRRHGNGQLRFIDVTATFQRLSIYFDEKNYNLGGTTVTFTKATLFRCLPALVQEFDAYDVILYSDVDVCVVDDISEIYEHKLGDNFIAGCRLPKRDAGGVLHLPERFHAGYVAGGIWLMNLRQMRAENLTERIIAIMLNPPFRLIWNDQDVMNLACETRTGHLSYRYCAIPRWKTELKLLGYADEYYPNGELREALYRPKIVHYASNKPWDGPCDDDDLWHFWHSRTGFPALGSADTDEPNVSAYLFKFLRIPARFVRAQFRRGELLIKIFGAVLRIRLRKVGEQ